jgi:tetratricopeptide (TPR) repeat protein
MKRPALTASLLAVALSSLLHSAWVDAQARRSDRDRQRAQQDNAQTTTETAENPYPNATRADPETKSSPRTMKQLQSAFDALNEGDNEAAAETFGKLDGNDRLSPYEQGLVDQGLAQIAYENDDIAEALRRWQKAIADNGLPNKDHFPLLYQVAQMQLSEERYDEALATLDRWQNESKSSRPDAHALRGNALYRLERYDDAIVALDQAIAAAGDNPDAALYELKMASYYEKEDFAGAAAALEALVQKRPNEVKHQINLAQMYIELEQNDRALGILEKAKAAGQLTEAEHWRQYYQLLSYADKPAQAAAAINEGIQSGALPADRNTLKALGDNFYMAEQLDQAIEAYGKAAALSTDDGNIDQQRGHLLAEQNRYPEAREALTAAFSKGKLTDEGTAYLLLGEAESEVGNDAAARAAFTKALGYERSKSNAEAWLKNL